MAAGESTDAAALALRTTVAKPYPGDASLEEQAAFLAAFAMLAPSLHNTQPWTLEVDGGTLALRPDRSRWLLVADPDQRALYIALGCALENVMVAARHFGVDVGLEVLPEDDPACAARLRIFGRDTYAAHSEDALFAAIARRRTSHELFDGAAISADLVERLRTSIADLDVTLVLTQESEVIERIDALVITADAALFADPAYRDELAHWIGQGVFGAPWLLAKLGQLAVSLVDVGDRIGRRTGELLMSSAAFGLIATSADDHGAHVDAGRALERLFLVATSEGLGLQPISELMQSPEIRPMVAEVLGVEGLAAQQAFRIGFPKTVETAHTPRRPFERVVHIARAVRAW